MRKTRTSIRLPARLARKSTDDLTKAEASMKIDELRQKTGVADAPAKPKRKAKK